MKKIRFFVPFHFEMLSVFLDKKELDLNMKCKYASVLSIVCLLARYTYHFSILNDLWMTKPSLHIKSTNENKNDVQILIEDGTKVCSRNAKLHKYG